jgi:hypothetical protein
MKPNDNLIVSSTEPTGSNRKKVWIQDTDKKIYVKNDNDVYEEFIKSEVYSTEEIRIGTWINGKPLYRKVFYIDSLPNKTSKSITHGITNIDKFINMYGIYATYTTDYKTAMLVNDYNGDNYIRTTIDNSYIYISTSTDRSTLAGYIIVEYTKTTD